jgi:glycosyltransferase involved in cell wall biosynthesis
MADDLMTRAGAASLAQAPADESVAVGVVVPLYRHAMLVAEAVADLMTQSISDRLHVVIVNDGCDFDESDAVGRGLAALHPDRITYLFQSNRGLSGARNTGVDYLLDAFPDLPAIYFMDSDNRLGSRALERALDSMLADPKVGWVYPDIDMFGVSAAFDYGGVYSPLLHRQVNVSEAGSLVRAQALREGVRFDEAMRLGYEDWSFFLSLAERGWIGRHLDDFGFRYRKRGESMLTESDRLDGELRAFIKRKHKSAFSLRTLAALEQQEAPRYALYICDVGQVALMTDPRGPHELLAPDAFARRYWRARMAPSRFYSPPILGSTTLAALQAMGSSGIDRWALWRLERSLEGAAFAMLTLERGSSDERAVDGPLAPDGRHMNAQLVLTSARVLAESLADPSSAWADSIAAATPQPIVEAFTATIPDFGDAVSIPSAHGMNLLSRLLRLSHWRQGAQERDTWRTPGLPDRSTLYRTVRAAAGDPPAAVFPAAREAGRHVGFLLPMFSFGGVEKAAGELAREMRAKGWIPHLFVGPATSLRLPRHLEGLFESVSFLDGPLVGGWDEGASYLGTPMPSIARDKRDYSALVGAMGWLDVMVNCHSVAGHAVAAPLRQAGVSTICYQHVIDQSVYGRPVGHPQLGVAYEHAYDAIACCSHTLTQWFLAMGVPHSKLVTAANAPGYPMTDEAVGVVLARRAPQSRTGPLRALFLGRLDRQKGVGELIRTIEATRRDGIEIDWRIIGSPVLDRPEALTTLKALGIKLEEPSHDERALTNAYSWADVLVMTSIWEGLPLTVLEAMRLGAVPVATDVGAVSEVIEHGANGFLLRPQRASADALAILSQLAADRGKLAEVSASAARTLAGRVWSRQFAPLIERIAHEVARKQSAAKS